MYLGLFFELLFFALPIATLVLFILSLCSYISAKKQNKAVPNTYSDNEIKKRKIMLIVMSVIVAVFVMIVLGFIILMLSVLAYM